MQSTGCKNINSHIWVHNKYWYPGLVNWGYLLGACILVVRQSRGLCLINHGVWYNCWEASRWGKLWVLAVMYTEWECCNFVEIFVTGSLTKFCQNDDIWRHICFIACPASGSLFRYMHDHFSSVKKLHCIYLTVFLTDFIIFMHAVRHLQINWVFSPFLSLKCVVYGC